jgi:hypothetical protein
MCTVRSNRLSAGAKIAISKHNRSLTMIDLDETEPKWQPVVAIMQDGQRLECACGAQAIFLAMKREAPDEIDSTPQLAMVAYCQPCYT